jgi:hypothetical protein
MISDMVAIQCVQPDNRTTGAIASFLVLGKGSRGGGGKPLFAGNLDGRNMQ